MRFLLRDPFASLLYKPGHDLVALQESPREVDLSTTAVYLHLDASHLKVAAKSHALASGI